MSALLLFSQSALDNILASFTKTLARLDSLAKQNRVKAEKKAEKARVLREEGANLDAEANQAEATADRIRDLLGMKEAV